MKKSLVWISLYAIAMGLLEAVVVVYLRELYYKDGFDFPLRPIPAFIARMEFYRELATLVMLLAAGILTGKSRLQRFAYFVLAFAVWDIFYYVFLYLFLGWPQSLSTWDILFLVPFPWVGPVWSPCLLCLIMITGSLYIIKKTNEDPEFRVRPLHWTMMIGGAAICILAFMWDYLSLKIKEGQYWSINSPDALFEDLKTYTPVSFNHPLFFTGFILMCTAIILSIRYSKTLQSANDQHQSI
jgi:hypothetical protein